MILWERIGRHDFYANAGFMLAKCKFTFETYYVFWIGSHIIWNILLVSFYSSVISINQYIQSFWYNEFFWFIFGDRKPSKQPVDRGSTVLMRGFSCIKLLYAHRFLWLNWVRIIVSLTYFTTCSLGAVYRKTSTK